MMMVHDFRARAQKLMVLFVMDAKRTFEAKRALQAKRRVIKKQLSVKLGLWPKKYWWFRLGPNKSHVATANGYALCYCEWVTGWFAFDLGWYGCAKHHEPNC